MSKFSANRDSLVIGAPEIKHRKNFIMENIKQLKELQKMMQQKNKKEVPKMKKDLSMKGNMIRKGKLSSSVDSLGSFATHVSTPITAVANPRPAKNIGINKNMQTSRSCNDITKAKDSDRNDKKYGINHAKNYKFVKNKSKTDTKKDKLKEKEIVNEKEEKPIAETMSAGDSLRAAFLQNKENKDFVKTNTYTFYPEKPKPAKLDPTRAPPSYKKGTIPKYLQEEKKEQAIRKSETAEIDPLCPPGHIRLSDHERKIHLDKIKKNYAELISELNRLPVRSDSLRIKHKRIELEKELEKLEAGIKIFSKDVLYVKLSGP